MESGNVSTGEQRRLTVFETTNSSFQNQPPADAAAAAAVAPAPGTRKRGIAALLQDVTNVVAQPQSRNAGEQARRTMLLAMHREETLHKEQQRSSTGLQTLKVH